MRLADIMTTDVLEVAPTLGADEAWRRMRTEQIHHLVVVAGRSVIGILSDRDLGGARGRSVRGDWTVGDLMTPYAISATPETTLREAADLMRGHVIGCLPVLDGDKLVGIVTITDLLELIADGVARPVEDEPRAPAPRGPTRRHPRTAPRRPH